MSVGPSSSLVLLAEAAPGVHRLTLNSPGDRNALSAAMREAILDSLAKAREAGAAVVIVSGDDRAFSSGYKLDPGVMRPKTPVEDRRRLTEVVTFMKAYRDQPLVTIAEIRGYCLAGGTDLMLASDIAVAANDANIGVPNVRGLGITMLLPVWSWLVGPQRAKLLALTGDLLTGAEAAQNGLISASYEEAELSVRTRELAERIAMVPQELTAVVKHALNAAWDSAGFSEATNRAVELDVLAHLSAPVVDFWDRVEREGLKSTLVARDDAFEQGRTPNQIAPPVAGR